MNLEQIKRPAAIFDLDGTILDSVGIWREIDADFLGKRGLAVPEDYMRQIATLGFEEAAVYTREKFGLAESEKAIIEEWFQAAIEAYRYHIELKPGAKAYLEDLHHRGVRLGVATSSDEELYTPALQRAGIYDLFETFVMSREVVRGKGYPDIYIEAANRLGMQVEDCVVYEDILKALMGAKKGGFVTVAVYDDDSAGDWERLRSEADVSIRSYEQLLREREIA